MSESTPFPQPAQSESGEIRRAEPLPRSPEFPQEVELHVDLFATRGTSSDAPAGAMQTSEALETRAQELVAAAFEIWADEGQDDYAHWLDEGRMRLRHERVFTRHSSASVRVMGRESLDLAARRRDGVLRVCVLDRYGPRRTGFWAAMVAGHALAEGLGGVLIDPARRGLSPVRANEVSPRGDGRVHVGRHIAVPASFGADGFAWLTTLGLEKFGLPELELRRVPPNMVESSARVLAGVAQLLLERDHPMPRVLHHPIELSLAHVQWALGLRPTALGHSTERVSMRLDERMLRHSYGRRLELGPGDGFHGRREAWAQWIMRELVGPPRARAKSAQAA